MNLRTAAKFIHPLQHCTVLRYSTLAQLEEHRIHTPKVSGSNPLRATNHQHVDIRILITNQDPLDVKN